MEAGRPRRALRPQDQEEVIGRATSGEANSRRAWRWLWAPARQPGRRDDEGREPISGRPHTQGRLALSSAPPVSLPPPPTPMKTKNILMNEPGRPSARLTLQRH